VNIIQHPNGEPKQLALRENKVTGLPENRFLHYRTDTAAGSSGSPVFNDQWDLIALHHSGVPARDSNGQILATDNQVWRKSMGEHRIQWLANEGVRTAAIIAALKSLDQAEPQRRIREQLLAVAGESPPAVDRPTQVSRPPAAGDQRQALVRQVLLQSKQGGADGRHSVTLNIPLQVTLSFGEPLIQSESGSGGAPYCDDFTKTGTSTKTPDGPASRLGFAARTVPERRCPLFA
jgi:endonuclease G, mitochondrial